VHHDVHDARQWAQGAWDILGLDFAMFDEYSADIPLYSR
jgi:hypothetical protein